MSKGNKLRIIDEVTFKPISIVEDAKALRDNLGLQGQGLLVKVAATHSGIVTRNNTFYLPDKMRAAIPTWTAQYPKPILVHHNKEADPIGRVVAAEYVDLSGSLHSSIQNKLFRDSASHRTAFTRFNDGTMSYGMQVDYVRDLIAKSTILDDKNYEGLGYIVLTANITNPDAIQKVRDGRYLTGSVSASTDKAVCSICKQDWIEEGKCDHDPGQMYDDAKAFIIAGNFDYEEWSFVNQPADRHSKALELLNSAQEDRNNKLSDKLIADALSMKSHAAHMMLISAHDRLHYEWDPQLMDTDSGSMGDQSMMPPPPKDIYDLHEALHKEAKDQGIDGSLVLGMLDSSLPKNLWPPYPKAATPTDSFKEKTNTMSTQATPDKKDVVKDETTTLATETAVVEAPTTAPVVETPSEDTTITRFTDSTTEDLENRFNAMDIASDSLSDEDVEVIYELMTRELGEPVTVGDATKTETIIVNDAKLSTKARKGLASSTFCGPGRSFPVPDCAHVTAARRLIGRYKGAGDKSSILACVSRKAKAMGCGGDSVVTEDIPAAATTQDNAPKAGCAECDKEVRQAQDAAAAKDKEIADLKDQLKALRDEFKYLYTDVISLEDQLIKAKMEAKVAKANRVADFELLSGKTVSANRAQAVERVSAMDDKSLNSMFESIDVSKIVDKLNSGLSREPSGTVTPDNDVTLVTDAANGNASDEASPEDPKVKKQIMDTHEYIAKTRGAAAAEKYLARMKRQNLIK